jgi:uncharacterized membrane protein YkvA (DUF1232 family)
MEMGKELRYLNVLKGRLITKLAHAYAMASLRELRENLKKYIELTKGVYKDRRTPGLPKAILWFAIAYALSPIDLIPDFIPVLGQLDDALILPLLLFLAFRLIPKRVYEEHRKRIFRR